MWNESDSAEYFLEYFLPRLRALLSCETNSLLAPRIQPVPRLIVAGIDEEAPDKCFGPPPPLSSQTKEDIKKWSKKPGANAAQVPMRAKVWAIVDGQGEGKTECITRQHHHVRMVTGTDAGCALKAGRKPKGEPMLFNSLSRQDCHKLWQIIVISEGKPINRLKARFAKVPGGSTTGRWNAHYMLAKMAVDPKHAAAFVSSTMKPPTLHGDEAEAVIQAMAAEAVAAEDRANGLLTAADAADAAAAGTRQRRSRGGVSFTANTAAQHAKRVREAAERLRKSSGAGEMAEVWEWEALRLADFKMTDILAYPGLDFEAEVDQPIILRVPVVATRNNECCPNPAWLDFPFMARFCFCRTHCEMRGVESNVTHSSMEEIASHAKAAPGKSSIDHHVNPVFRRLGMRVFTRNPNAKNPKACFAYTCDGKQADAWVADVALMKGHDLDDDFESGDIASTYFKGLCNCIMELSDEAVRKQRIDRLKALAAMCLHYALAMQRMSIFVPTEQDRDVMEMEISKYLALKEKLIGRLTVYDQWLYTVAGQMGGDFVSFVANSAECMEGTQKDLNIIQEGFKGFGNCGRKPNKVKARPGDYCDSVYMRARDSSRPPNEEVRHQCPFILSSAHPLTLSPLTLSPSHPLTLSPSYPSTVLAAHLRCTTGQMAVSPRSILQATLCSG